MRTQLNRYILSIPLALIFGVGATAVAGAAGGTKEEKKPKSGESAEMSGQTQAEIQRVMGEDAKFFGIDQLGKEEIRTLQQELKNRGHLDGPLDGVAGPSTNKALKEFVKARATMEEKLADEGKISSDVAKVLGLDASQIQKVSGEEPEAGSKESGQQPPMHDMGTPEESGQQPTDQPDSEINDYEHAPSEEMIPDEEPQPLPQ